MDKPFKVTYTCHDCDVSRIMWCESRLKIPAFAECPKCKTFVRFTSIIDTVFEANVKRIFGNENSGVQGIEPD
jgi:hypothetical protein